MQEDDLPCVLLECCMHPSMDALLHLFAASSRNSLSLFLVPFLLLFLFSCERKEEDSYTRKRIKERGREIGEIDWKLIHG